MNEQKVEDLDQVNIPDPVAQELARLKEQITALQARIDDLQEQQK